MTVGVHEPELIVLCAGGHARVVIDVMRKSGKHVAALLDANPKLHGTTLDGVPIIGSDDMLDSRSPDSVLLINALGNRPAIGDSGLAPRGALFDRLAARGFKFAQVVSPDAMVSAHVNLDEGCHVLTGAIIHPGSHVGANAIVNTGAQLDHDCRIGAHAHIAPGAVLCGNVTVGALCHVGAGAVIIQGITIGEGAVIGAGAIVTGDIGPGATVVGRAASLAKAHS